jgi:hypothetical protein
MSVEGAIIAPKICSQLGIVGGLATPRSPSIAVGAVREMAALCSMSEGAVGKCARVCSSAGGSSLDGLAPPSAGGTVDARDSRDVVTTPDWWTSASELDAPSGDAAVSERFAAVTILVASGRCRSRSTPGGVGVGAPTEVVQRTGIVGDE